MLGKFFSYVAPKVLETVQSPHSGTIKVVLGWGDTYLSTGALTQSGGIIRDLWFPTLKKIAAPGKTWLILGLSAGTAAGEIARRYAPKKIVGVEIDPIMVDLGKRYLGLGDIPNLQIIVADAALAVPKLPAGKFDYILVDMYCGDQLPKFVYSQKFIRSVRNLLTPKGTVIFNHLFYDGPKKAAAQQLVETLQSHFLDIKLFRPLTNLLIACSGSRSQGR